MTTMNTDDRDIVCEQDYTPLSNAELLTQIEQHTAIMYTSPIIDFDLEWITGPARALMARVEAAKAERNTAARRAFNAEADNQRLTAENRRLAARVAELEVELAAQSAQGWRDFTEHPPIGELIQIVTVIDAVREEPDGLYRIGNTSEWQAWRPAPQEPTQ